MSIAFRAANTPTNSGTPVASTFTVSKPAGMVAGDVMWLVVVISRNVSSTLSTPTGWTLRVTRASNYPTYPQYLYIFSKTVSSSEPSTYTLTATGQVAWDSAIVAYSGLNTSTPLAATAGASALGTSVTAPSVAGAASSVVLSIAASCQDPTPNVPVQPSVPSGTTSRAAGGNANNAFLQVVDAAHTSGATAARAFTGATSSELMAVTLAMQPFVSSPPNAPTLIGPKSNPVLDRSHALRLTWVFTDPDSGDTQSKVDIQYRLVGAGTWTTITSSIATTTSNNVAFYDFAAGFFAAGSYEWQVRAYDAAGNVGPYSSSGFWTSADTPATPVITAPAAGTVNATAVLTWTASAQDGYEVRRVADASGTADTGTIYEDSVKLTDAATRSVPFSFPVNGRSEHLQVRVYSNTLWSAWADVLVNVVYTPPARPTLVLTPTASAGKIVVAITNPTPGGSVPNAVSNDVWVRPVGGTARRLATGLAPGVAWTYWTPASGVAYEAQVVATAANGTSSTSLWSGGPLDPDAPPDPGP